MKTRTPRNWYDILVHCQVKPTTAAKWSEAFAREIVDGAFSAGEREVDDFLGQVLVESRMLERLEEDLFYTTAARLSVVWPTRFPTAESGTPFLRNPEALANKVYGGRMGNARPGDGWLYRGRGPIQLTGHDNYLQTGKAMGLDLVGNPNQVATPDIGLRIAIRWWERTLPDSVMDNLVAVTKRVNGGTHGLALRGELTTLAGQALAQ